MALSSTVTIIKAEKHDERVTITANLTLNDGVTDVLNKDFSSSFRPGLDEGVKQNIENVLLKKMQKAVDEYKESVSMEDNAKVKQLKTNLESRIIL